MGMEDIGETSESIAASRLLPTIGASPSRRELDRCVKSAQQSDSRSTATPLSGLATGLDKESAAAGHDGFHALPSENEMYTALMEEPGLLLMLCQVYAQDSVCLSALYEAPEVCQRVLGLTG